MTRWQLLSKGAHSKNLPISKLPAYSLGNHSEQTFFDMGADIMITSANDWYALIIGVSTKVVNISPDDQAYIPDI